MIINKCKCGQKPSIIYDKIIRVDNVDTINDNFFENIINSKLDVSKWCRYSVRCMNCGFELPGKPFLSLSDTINSWNERINFEISKEK